MRSESMTDRSRNRRGVIAAALAGMMVTLAACGGAADDAEARTDEPAAESAPAMAADTFQVTVDPSALPSTPLEREAFVEDVCTFASAEEIASFFTFHDGGVTVEGDDGLLAGTECAYAMEGLDVFLEVQFGELHASSTDEIELGGVAGVRRDARGSTLENRARVQIPFRIEGSPVRVVVIQFHVRGVPPADEETLRVAIDALGANLIERLGVEAFGG